jgi:hypothetical protein
MDLTGTIDKVFLESMEKAGKSISINDKDVGGRINGSGVGMSQLVGIEMLTSRPNILLIPLYPDLPCDFR